MPRSSGCSAHIAGGLFLAEGLRLREQGGQLYDLDVVGRPDTFTVSLDHLSGGWAA